MKKLFLLLLFIITISSAHALPIETFNITTHIPEVDITIDYCNQNHTFTCDEDFCFIDPINCGQTTLVIEDISYPINPILSLEIYQNETPYATNEINPGETWQVLNRTITFLNYQHETIEYTEIQLEQNETTRFILNNQSHSLHVYRISNGFTLIRFDSTRRVLLNLYFPQIINGCEIELVSQQFNFFNILTIDSFLK
jgi:hypothetical protein